VRAVTNQSGAVIERHDYLPLGEEVNPPAGAESRKFTGKQHDAETGLDYFGARYYSGARGRFTTVDPELGIETALVDPQRWHRYSYVGNRPTKVVDPDGRGWLAVAANLAKAAWKGQDYYSAVSGIAESTSTVFSMDARVGTGDRLWATGALVLEISGVSDLAKGAKSISGVSMSRPKPGSAGGPGASKDFSERTKDAARAESPNCVFCDTPTTREPGPTQSNIDHAISKKKGGNNSQENAQNTCRTCNLRKGTKSTEEFLERRQPH
jgi:RHS repeat-associated protein